MKLELLKKVRAKSTRQRIVAHVAYLLLAIAHATVAGELPQTSARAPLPMPHFPDTLHAVVWRNWGLVAPEHLARVLDTTPDRLLELAASMGLPAQVAAPPEMLRRGYITLIRRNWHLLPYDQLAELLSVTEDQLAFTLREDDFLYVKLGSLKPSCPRVEFAEPSPDARRQAANIKQIVAEHFGDRLTQPGAQRFAFVSELSQLPPGYTPPAQASHARGPRFVYSYVAPFGDPLGNRDIDPYPDGLLAQLRARDINGIWLHVVLRQLAPGGAHFPEWGDGHERRLANLKHLVERAQRHGLRIYLYLNEPRAMPASFFERRPDMAGVREGEFTALCTSNPAVREWLRNSLTHVFREVPGLGGIFTITASENLTHCASHYGQAGCPRCRHRSDAEIIAGVNATMEEGVHRSAPDAKVICWDWGWRRHGDAPEIIDRLPSETMLMSVSEWGLPIERGGVRLQIGEYSMSAVGPGPRATRHWQLAKQRGLAAVAKVQLNCTWELSSVPYLPVMDLVAQHCWRLADADINGFMLSWSLGGYPSANLELAARFLREPKPSVDAALQELAVRHFGEPAAPRVRRAWTAFSRAFQEFPYDGAVLYNGPQQMGPANLLHAAPTGYAATMVGLPYDDLNGWRGRYPPEILAGQFEKVARGWQDGLSDLQAAQRLVPDPLRQQAAADLRVAQAAHVHFASSANQAKFILARDRLLASADDAERSRLRHELLAILDREIDLARRLYDLAAVDSRLGYEPSNHYYYVPLDLVEKVISCVQLREDSLLTR